MIIRNKQSANGCYDDNLIHALNHEYEIYKGMGRTRKETRVVMTTILLLFQSAHVLIIKKPAWFGSRACVGWGKEGVHSEQMADTTAITARRKDNSERINRHETTHLLSEKIFIVRHF